MKRVITVLLAVLLALSLAACGSRVETKKLAGTWTCTIDVTDRMNAAVESVYAAAEEQGFSREEYDAAMEKAGITMDDMVAAIFAGVDEEELLSLLTGRSAALTGYCRAESGQLYLADTAAELAETADCLSYTLSDGTMTWTDAQGELSSQLTEQEQELLRVPLTWTKRAEESK